MKIKYHSFITKEKNKQILYLISAPLKLILKIIKFFRNKTELHNLKYKNYYINLNWFGRFGNNIQQLLLAYTNIKEHKIKVNLDDNFKSYLLNIGLDLKKLNKILNNQYEFNSDKDVAIPKYFFFFNETPIFFNKKYTRVRYSNSLINLLRVDSYTNESDLFKNLNSSVKKLSPIFKDLIAANYNNKLESFYKSEEVCFLHLRWGDINNKNQKHFVTNPYSYYKWLRGFFSKIIIITEPGEKHILLERICELFDVLKIQNSENFIEDFATIAKCKNLATSGVSTFPIAASIFNENLENFYCSNIYLKEHLNPNFLGSNINKVGFDCNTYWKEWFNSNKIDRYKLILNS